MKTPEQETPGNDFEAERARMCAFLEDLCSGLGRMDTIRPAGPEWVEYWRQRCDAAARIGVVLSELAAALARTEAHEELVAVIRQYSADPRFQLARFDWRALSGWNDEPGETPS